MEGGLSLLMQLEFHQLELCYGELRIVNRRRQSRLMSSLCEHGQQDPVWVVAKENEEGRFVLIDGYQRVTCLRRLGHDVVFAITMPLSEQDALCSSYNHDKHKTRNVFEDGWLIQALCERHGLSQGQVSVRLCKSESWVSRRLALVRDLPSQVQEKVRRGYVCPHGAMRYLVPLARAKPKDCERLMSALGSAKLSARELQILVSALRAATAEEREKILARPLLYVKSQQARGATRSDALAPDEQVIRDDLDMLGSIARRLILRLDHNASLAHYLPPLIEQAWSQADGRIAELRRLFEEQYHVRQGHSVSDFGAEETGIRPASHRP